MPGRVGEGCRGDGSREMESIEQSYRDDNNYNEVDGSMSDMTQEKNLPVYKYCL